MNYSASTVLTQTLCWRQDFRMDRVNTSNAAAGYPKANGVYNGSEFTPRDIDPWAYQRCVILDFSRPRLRTHCGSQKMTVAAMQMADMKVWAHRS